MANSYVGELPLWLNLRSREINDQLPCILGVTLTNIAVLHLLLIR